MPKSASAGKTPAGETLPPRPVLHKVNDVLSTLFYIVWIIIGVFFLLIIYGQIKQGALNSIVARPAGQTPQVQTSTETSLPGVGRVNIACVQQSLKQDTIQKLIVEGNTSTLTPEEKSKLDPCIVEAESPAPSPSPKQ